MNVTKYLDKHPGGGEVILEYAGKDATSMFEDINHSSEARNEVKKFEVGDLYIDPNKVQEEAELVPKKEGGFDIRAVVFLIIAVLIGYLYTQKL